VRGPFKLGDIRRGGLFAIAAAALFGASTPAAKVVVGNVPPLMLAGLLYLGSGLGLTLFRLASGRVLLPFSRADTPWLAAAVLFGGVLGPALLMFGLTSVTGSAASLLLTMEGVFTALIAWIVFREPFNGRVGIGMVAIVAGAALLALHGGSGRAALGGAVAVMGACLCWAIDNNCTSRIAAADAAALAAVKGLVAGVVNVTLVLFVGATLPSLGNIGRAALIGLLGYGISLVLFVLALREVGTARSGAYFSTAPFLGALLSIAFLHDTWGIAKVGAGILMAFGVWLHLTEQDSEGATEVTPVAEA
jgi:drug/metabolite transporter (DMT)-like permease